MNIKDKFRIVIILTMISIAFHYYYYDYNIESTLRACFTIIIFSAFISFMFSQYFKIQNKRRFIKLNKKTDSFYYWWNIIYGVLLVIGIIFRIIF